MTITMHEMDMLMSFVLQKPKEFIYANPTHTITKSQYNKFQSLVRRREQGEPIAYLIGHKEFYGLDFSVNKHVLIPRPDTETLIDVVLPHLTPGQVVCDIGTGSGNIAITLKKMYPNITMIATDISQKAITVAQQNAKKHHTKIDWYTGDTLRALPKKYYVKIDWLICNAPYLTKKESVKKSLRYEPRVALTPTSNTLSIIQKVIEQSPKFLAANGHIVLEIGYNQAVRIKTMLKKIYPRAAATVHKDLGGFDRVLLITPVPSNSSKTD